MIFILLAFISSFLFTIKAYAYVISTADSIKNTFTIKPTVDIKITYYSVFNNVKTKIKNDTTVTYNTAHNLVLNDITPDIISYDDVKYYIDNTEYTNANYSTIKDATIEIDFIYTTTNYNSIYINLEEQTFTGSNHLDTGIYFQTFDTLDKDYEISFDIEYIDPANKTSGQEQPTIMNAKDEDNNMYPGNVVRLNTGNTNTVQMSGRWNNARVTKNINNTGEPIHVVVTRTGGVVKGRATYTGYDSGLFTYYNQANWTINQYTNDTITFGARQYNGSYDRYFIGVISNIQVLLHE